MTINTPTKNYEALSAVLTEKREEMNARRELLTAAYHRFNDAIGACMKAEANLSNNPQSTLIDHAYSNRADSSGGISPRNIEGALIRENCIQLLKRGRFA